MSLTNYPVRIDPDGDQYLATFKDIPEALTGGATKEEALTMAKDALITAMDFYFEDRRKVPAPSAPAAVDDVVELPASLALKVQLLNLMIDQNIRPIDLARRLDVKPQSVTRLMDLNHATKVDQLFDAFKALGKRLDIVIS